MRIRGFVTKMVLAAGVALAAPAAVLAQDDTVNFAADDAEMNAAIAEAQATLPLFLDHVVQDDGTAVEEAMIKVGLPAQGATGALIEHIWVGPFARMPDGSFIGLLANEPVDLGDLEEGDEVEFTGDMITDWHLPSPAGAAWGSYTLRVAHAQGSFGETPFEDMFEADPVPADWR